MVKYHHLMMEEVMCDMLVVLTLIPHHRRVWRLLHGFRVRLVCN